MQNPHPVDHRYYPDVLDENNVIQIDGDATIIVDTPSGPLDAHTRIRNGRLESVAIQMVPSFVFSNGRELDIAGYGKVPVDLVCVGGFFAMVAARSIGIDLAPKNSHHVWGLSRDASSTPHNSELHITNDPPEVAILTSGEITEARCAATTE